MLIIIITFILLAIITPIRIFKPTFIFLAGITSMMFPITTNQILTTNPITYATLDPLLQWAITLILITTSVILYIDQIDVNNNKQGDW